MTSRSPQQDSPADDRRPVVLTVGHSTRSFEEILGLLKTYSVDILLDIRNRHYSNLIPEFSRQKMKMRLVSEGIVYVFMGDLLGETPRSTDVRTSLGSVDLLKVEGSEPFTKGLEWILDQSRHSRVCLFCGEADPYTCHRHYLVGQNLVSRGVRVRHIMASGQLEDCQADLFHAPEP